MKAGELTSDKGLCFDRLDPDALAFFGLATVYSQIPNVSVYPLYLSEKELNSKSMLAM